MRTAGPAELVDLCRKHLKIVKITTPLEIEYFFALLKLTWQSQGSTVQATHSHVGVLDSEISGHLRTLHTEQQMSK